MKNEVSKLVKKSEKNKRYETRVKEGLRKCGRDGERT